MRCGPYRTPPAANRAPAHRRRTARPACGQSGQCRSCGTVPRQRGPAGAGGPSGGGAPARAGPGAPPAPAAPPPKPASTNRRARRRTERTAGASARAAIPARRTVRQTAAGQNRPARRSRPRPKRPGPPGRAGRPAPAGRSGVLFRNRRPSAGRLHAGGRCPRRCAPRRPAAAGRRANCFPWPPKAAYPPANLRLNGGKARAARQAGRFPAPGCPAPAAAACRKRSACPARGRSRTGHPARARGQPRRARHAGRSNTDRRRAAGYKGPAGPPHGPRRAPCARRRPARYSGK